ncbi:MAG: TonB-dependent receptor [Bacteroidota bacterium]|nr:MAG: TonB-dependent receptor [Bacteroidota bacterium]
MFLKSLQHQQAQNIEKSSLPKIRWFFVLFLLVFSCFQVYSQLFVVTDAESNEPLELVTVTSTQPRATTLTNAKGQANIAAFKGAEIIEIRVIGYHTQIRSYQQLQESSFKVQLTPSLVSIDEVVVSASRWNQKTSELPQKISSISTRSVIIHNPQTAADMLALSGKVFIQKSQQGGGSPMIRGFATSRLLYSVDGVRMNTAIFRSGNIQNVISLDPFAMENTEVLFGPGSVIYGSDAIGGVMSFQTLTPQFSLEEKTHVKGNITARYATANQEKTGHFDINLGGKKWAGLTSISSNSFDHLRMGSYGPEEYLRPFYVERQDSMDVVKQNSDNRIQNPTGYTQFNLMQKISYKPSDQWQFHYGFHYSQTSDYGRYDRHIRYKNGQPRYGEWNYGPQIWMMNNLNAIHHANRGIYDQLSVHLAQQFFEESRISRNINDPLREIRTEKVDALSANFDFTKSAGGQHRIIYGAESIYNKVRSTGVDEDIEEGTSEEGPSRYPQSTWESYALYLTDQYKINSKVTLHFGIRYTHYLLNAKFDTSFYSFPFTEAHLNKGSLSGSFGVVYRPNKNWVLNTNASTAFRAPNVDDMGKVFDSEQGTVTVPNPSLEAEYAYNLDAGIARIINDWLKIDLTIYGTYLNNAMVRRDYTLNGQDSIMYSGVMSQVQAIQNAAFAIVYGLQAGLEVKLPAGFGISSDFNLQKGEEELDNGETSPTRHAPPWFGNTKLTFVAGRFNVKLYATYSGEKTFAEMPEEEIGKPEIYAIDPEGNPWSPGWYTLNLKMRYQLNNLVTLSAGVENITDQRYKPYSSGIAASGLNFIGAVRANF